MTVVFPNQIVQLPDHLLQFFFVSIFLNQCKFITAIACKKTVLVKNPCQAVGECLDEFIPFFVSECIVDMFQIIEIKHHNTDVESIWTAV